MRLFLLLGTILFFSALIYGADNAPQQQADPQQQTDPNAGVITDDEKLQAAPIEQVEKENPENELILADVDEPVNAEQGLHRFIPTEEISQDLGVSFPIDI
jgi:hypothetical protein